MCVIFQRHLKSGRSSPSTVSDQNDGQREDTLKGMAAVTYAAPIVGKKQAVSIEQWKGVSEQWITEKS
jgi:hypothetical protein